MATGNALRVDGLIVTLLSGREKLRALVVNRNGTIQGWAQSHGLYPAQVHMTLSGTREYPEVRERLAADFDIPRDEIDALLDADGDTSEGSSNA